MIFDTRGIVLPGCLHSFLRKQFRLTKMLCLRFNFLRPLSNHRLPPGDPFFARMELRVMGAAAPPQIGEPT